MNLVKIVQYKCKLNTGMIEIVVSGWNVDHGRVMCKDVKATFTETGTGITVIEEFDLDLLSCVVGAITHIYGDIDDLKFLRDGKYHSVLDVDRKLDVKVDETSRLFKESPDDSTAKHDRDMAILEYDRFADVLTNRLGAWKM